METFDGFIGQSAIKARLQAAIADAKSKRVELNHVLLVGPTGTGKATLAVKIATAMGVNMLYSNSEALKESSDLAGLLLRGGAANDGVCRGDVLLIENIDQVNAQLHPALRQVLGEFQLDVQIDPPNSRLLRLQLPRFTMVATAAHGQSMPPELVSCFPITETLSSYTPEELKQIEETKGRRFERLSFEMNRIYPGCTNYFSEKLGRYVTFDDIEQFAAQPEGEPELTQIGLEEYNQMQEQVADLQRQLADAQRPIVHQKSGGGLVLGGLIGYAIAKDKYCPHCGRDID